MGMENMKNQGILAPGAGYEVVGTGYGFTEGPAADKDGNIYFSDGRNNTIYLYRPGKAVSAWVTDSTDANGMMFNRKGELLVCEGAAYRVVAFDVKSREKRVLASEFEGLRFNEPNDLTIDSSGGFYFTDPNYQHRGQATVRKEDTYYVSAEGRISRVSTVCEKPNGVLLTPDETVLYLADTKGRAIFRYRVAGPGLLADGQRWIGLDCGPDGMTLDEHGNLYIGCGKAGVRVFSAQGEQLQEIAVPYASNLVFGGPDFTTLFVTAGEQFLAIRTTVMGVKPLPAR
jgi:gluconolactonase